MSIQELSLPNESVFVFRKMTIFPHSLSQKSFLLLRRRGILNFRVPCRRSNRKPRRRLQTAPVFTRHRKRKPRLHTAPAPVSFPGAADPDIAAGLFVRGLLKGFGADVEQQCVDKSTTMDGHVRQAIQKAKGGDMPGAAALLATAIKVDMPDVLRGCDKSKSDVQEILKALDQFKTPQALIYHIGQVGGGWSLIRCPQFPKIFDVCGCRDSGYAVFQRRDYGLVIMANRFRFASIRMRNAPPNNRAACLRAGNGGRDAVASSTLGKAMVGIFWFWIGLVWRFWGRP